MVVGSQNDGKDFMVFTDSPIDGAQMFRSPGLYCRGNVLEGLMERLTKM